MVLGTQLRANTVGRRASLNGMACNASAGTRRSPRSMPALLTDRLRPIAGRLIYDGCPTGVAVSWAQQHGGPWPSTNCQHTSVGTTAVRPFPPPVTWQSAPQSVLPPELTDGITAVLRRIDGVLHLPE